MSVSDHFTIWDWAVVIGYLLLCTWVGHRLRGQQATIRDFFLGGRSLPWPAVSGSIIATEISGVTFIGVPGMLFYLHLGDMTYLQWAIGSMIGRILVGIFFVRVYYEQQIYSPYDYMGRRLGNPIKVLATVLFTVGSILGQSVRVLVAALPLRVVTDLPLAWCIVIIGLFAVGWTLMGGMRTVIWTDVMQFFLFTFGGILALVWIIGGLQGGFAEFIATGSQFDRFDFLNTELRADLEFTLWVALLAVPFQNLAMFGVDQLNAQRMFCCRNASAARKALIASCAGQVLALLMLLVGTALVVHYHNNPFTPEEARVVFPVDRSLSGDEAQAAAMEAMEAATRLASKDGTEVSNVPAPGDADVVFPMWITTMLPIGLSGLVLAGLFAAAISSLDSILAALSQTTLSLIYHPERRTDEELAEMNLVLKSRLLVVFWGLVLTGFTFLLHYLREALGIPIISLAFGMTSYTVGPLLALFLCSMAGYGRPLPLIIGVVISLVLVMFVRMDVWVLVEAGGWSIDWLAHLPTYELTDVGAVRPTVSYVWAWPVTMLITLAFGSLGGRRRDNM